MKFAVLGSNTSTSLSPKLHSIVYDILELNHSYSFIESSDIDQDMLLKYNGLNITNPFKKSIINYVDNVDPLAEKIGSVNCIKYTNSKIYGFNTDYYGFNQFIKSNNIELFNKNILVVGAGGASLSICSYLNDINKKFKILNRTYTNTQHFINKLNISNNSIYDGKLKHYDIIINCLPNNVNFLKMLERNEIDYHRSTSIIDINYLTNINYINDNQNYYNGIDMLIHQAIKSIEIWIEKDISQIVDYQIIKDRLKKDA
tara:strand:+ start:1062 stop:1835 length:774 start_codon:yes stop_codon:yes gene_type:complete